MRLENLLALTYGKLINEPFVNKFENIVFDAKVVKRGDLFVAFDESTIDDAILNGAYGVLFDKPTQISDSEIAWIKVVNIETALQKLLRFKLIEKNMKVYSVDNIILQLASQIIISSSFIVLKEDIKAVYQKLWDAPSDTTLLFSPYTTDGTIFTDIQTIPKRSKNTIEIKEKTLFETSFIYNTIFYERQFISPFFISYLDDLFYLFKNEKIDFRLRKFSQLENFEAIFVNQRLEEKEFGSTDKVLIFEKRVEIVEEEIKFLTQNAPWAEAIFIINNQCNIEYLKYKNIYRYKNEREISKILQREFFHFALIVGVSKESVVKEEVKNLQLSLGF